MVIYKLKSKSHIIAIILALLLSTSGIAFAKDYPTHIAELPNTNNKMPGSLVYVYESQFPGYFQYINGRYGFTMDFPNTFTIAFLPANSDGAKFRLPDGSAELSASGGHTFPGNTLDDYYFLVLQGIEKEGGVQGYSQKGDDSDISQSSEKIQKFF